MVAATSILHIFPRGKGLTCGCKVKDGLTLPIFPCPDLFLPVPTQSCDLLLM